MFSVKISDAIDWGALYAQAAARRDAEIRRMLGLWVSEIEPVVIYSHAFDLLGLGFGDGREVIIAANPTASFIPWQALPTEWPA